jgi:amino acid transporter
MFFSYMIICLPTKWVSRFNILATVMGTVVLVITTIMLPIKAPELNSAKSIFTDVGNRVSDLCDSRLFQAFRPATMGLDGPVGGLSA